LATKTDAPEEKIPIYTKAIQMLESQEGKQDWADPYTGMGNAMNTLKRYSESEYYLLKGHKIEPHDEMVLYNLARTSRDGGKDAEAIKWFEQASAVSPDNHNILTDLGNLLSKNPANFPKAEKYYKLAYKFEPNSHVKCRNLGALYANAKKPKDASDYFKRAHELEPTSLKYIEYTWGT
jgi:tetratricopeptide (TPR) repeat protein